MKIVFSGNGFDSGAGEAPSPIIERKPFSLPTRPSTSASRAVREKVLNPLRNYYRARLNHCFLGRFSLFIRAASGAVLHMTSRGSGRPKKPKSGDAIILHLLPQRAMAHLGKGCSSRGDAKRKSNLIVTEMLASYPVHWQRDRWTANGIPLRHVDFGHRRRQILARGDRLPLRGCATWQAASLGQTLLSRTFARNWA